MRRQNAVAAAIDKPKHVVLRDLLAEPDTARTQNAALVVERHPRTQLDVLRFLHLVLEEARIRAPVLDTELLQPAFARLIADRAIERMIDEKEFHYAFATLLRQRRIGPNAHSVADVLGAGNLRARHPVDDRFAVSAELRLAIRPHLRQSHFDQAHSAIARRA